MSCRWAMSPRMSWTKRASVRPVLVEHLDHGGVVEAAAAAAEGGDGEDVLADGVVGDAEAELFGFGGDGGLGDEAVERGAGDAAAHFGGGFRVAAEGAADLGDLLAEGLLELGHLDALAGDGGEGGAGVGASSVLDDAGDAPEDEGDDEDDEEGLGPARVEEGADELEHGGRPGVPWACGA